MNSNIAKRDLTLDNEVKNHQAYATELSRLKKADDDCMLNDNCDEFIRLGGKERLRLVKSLVDKERKKDETRRKIGKDTGMKNYYQDENNPTSITKNPTKNTDHSGGEVNKILSNSQALSEELKRINEIIQIIK